MQERCGRRDRRTCRDVHDACLRRTLGTVYLPRLRNRSAPRTLRDDKRQQTRQGGLTFTPEAAREKQGMMSSGVNRLRGLATWMPGFARRGYNSFGNNASPWAGDNASMITPRDFAAQHPRRRAELIARIRREIQLGIYETPEKWAITLDRLCDELERLAREAEREDSFPIRYED